MRNNAFTLTEFIIVIVISTIVVVTIGFNLVAANRFRIITQENVELSREARIAVNHMTRVLRFADPSTITASSDSISATIEAGHLPFITSDTVVTYARNAANDTLTYTQGGAGAEPLAGGGQADIDIQFFKGDWDGNVGGTIDSAASADSGA